MVFDFLLESPESISRLLQSVNRSAAMMAMVMNLNLSGLAIIIMILR